MCRGEAARRGSCRDSAIKPALSQRSGGSDPLLQGRGRVVARDLVTSRAEQAHLLRHGNMLTVFAFLPHSVAFPGFGALPSRRTSWQDYAPLTLGKAYEIPVHAVV